MGVRPQRIDIVTSADGVDFDDCYENRKSFMLDDVRVNMIALADLKKNKKATGRHIDLSDLENLE